MAPATVIRLLGGEMSPFTARARLALELRGVEYELVDEPLGPRKSDRLLAANPVYGKIPVLLLPDGRAICESAVIVQFVDDLAAASSSSSWQGPAQAQPSSKLLPEDPYERAMHRFWTVFIDDRFWPALDAVSLAPTPEARAQAVVDARTALQLLEEAFRSRGYDGDAEPAPPGLLDVALGCFLPAVRACERLHGLTLLDDFATPLLQRWNERFSALPAAARVLPDTEKVVQFTRFLQAKFRVDLTE